MLLLRMHLLLSPRPRPTDGVEALRDESCVGQAEAGPLAVSPSALQYFAHGIVVGVPASAGASQRRLLLKLLLEFFVLPVDLHALLRVEPGREGSFFSASSSFQIHVARHRHRSCSLARGKPTKTSEYSDKLCQVLLLLLNSTFFTFHAGRRCFGGVLRASGVTALCLGYPSLCTCSMNGERCEIFLVLFSEFQTFRLFSGPPLRLVGVLPV